MGGLARPQEAYGGHDGQFRDRATPRDAKPLVILRKFGFSLYAAPAFRGRISFSKRRAVVCFTADACAILRVIMLGIVLNLPPSVEYYLATNTWAEIFSQALLFLGWIPIFGVLIWGFTQVWIDYKQGQYFAHLHWVLLQISVPPGSINTPKGMENFFNNLAGSKSALTWKETRLQGKFQAYFSLEIVSDEGDVRFYIRCQDKHRDMVEAAMYAQYPEAQISLAEDYVDVLPDKYPNDTHKVFGSEFIVSKPDYYPLRTYMEFEHMGEKDNRFKDPFLNIIELMGKMGKDEHFWIQIIIMQPDEQEWAKEGEKYLLKLMGKEEKHASGGLMTDALGGAAGMAGEFMKQATGLEIGGAAHGEEKKKDDFAMFRKTSTERYVEEAIANKISKIGWYTKLRVVYAGPMDNFRKPLMASAMKGMLHPYGHLNMQKLGMHTKATPKDDYFWMEWTYYEKMYKLVKRYKNRLLGQGASPFILNSEELATLFHFPAADARTPVLAASASRRAEAPLSLPFAQEGESDIIDWKDKDKAHTSKHDAHHGEEGTLAVPTPHAHKADVHAPTPAAPSHTAEFMPQPGRPAPLPPGLDLRPEPLSDDDDAPSNLPVL